MIINGEVRRMRETENIIQGQNEELKLENNPSILPCLC